MNLENWMSMQRGSFILKTTSSCDYQGCFNTLENTTYHSHNLHCHFELFSFCSATKKLSHYMGEVLEDQRDKLASNLTVNGSEYTI